MGTRKSLCIALTIFFLWAPAAWAAEKPAFDWIEEAWSWAVEPLQELTAGFSTIFRVVMEETSAEGETVSAESTESTPMEPEPTPPTVMIGGHIQPIG